MFRIERKITKFSEGQVFLFLLSIDYNLAKVAHRPIDLKNPKANYNKSAGFTQAEIDQFENLLANGFTDSFRMLYPDLAERYTFWSYRSNARARNTGWRLDYFLISEGLKPWIVDHLIHSDVLGSDHCPIELILNINQSVPLFNENFRIS